MGPSSGKTLLAIGTEARVSPMLPSESSRQWSPVRYSPREAVEPLRDEPGVVLLEAARLRGPRALHAQLPLDSGPLARRPAGSTSTGSTPKSCVPPRSPNRAANIPRPPRLHTGATAASEPSRDTPEPLDRPRPARFANQRCVLPAHETGWAHPALVGHQRSSEHPVPPEHVHPRSGEPVRAQRALPARCPPPPGAPAPRRSGTRPGRAPPAVARPSRRRGGAGPLRRRAAAHSRSAGREEAVPSS